MKNLRELREQFGLTQLQLGQKLGFGQHAVSTWEKGTREPDLTTLVKISELFSISIDELLGHCERDKTHIPVLGKIPAGIPIEMIEDVLDYEDINPEMLIGGKEYFALKVKGDSMSPKFLEGDILIVRKQDDCENGDFAIVAVNGYDATFKKVIKKENCIILQPLNPNFEPVIYDNDQIATLPVHILGVVVEIRRTI